MNTCVSQTDISTSPLPSGMFHLFPSLLVRPSSAGFLPHLFLAVVGRWLSLSEGGCVGCQHLFPCCCRHAMFFFLVRFGSVLFFGYCCCCCILPSGRWTCFYIPRCLSLLKQYSDWRVQADLPMRKATPQVEMRSSRICLPPFFNPHFCSQQTQTFFSIYLAFYLSIFLCFTMNQHSGRSASRTISSGVGLPPRLPLGRVFNNDSDATNRATVRRSSSLRMNTSAVSSNNSNSNNQIGTGIGTGFGGGGGEVDSGFSSDLDTGMLENNGSVSETVRVSVRMRPPNVVELARAAIPQIWELDEEQRVIRASAEFTQTLGRSTSGTGSGYNFSSSSSVGGIGSSSGLGESVFMFENIISGSDNSILFDNSVRHIVQSAMAGLNGTVFAYGQSNSGKTHSIIGTPTNPGMIPRAVNEVFDIIRHDSKSGREYLLRVAYMEIYNENIRDLLAPETTNLRIHEDKRRGIYVSPLKEEIVTTPSQVMKIIQRGESNRKTGATDFNEHSSRSHAIFQFIIESRAPTIQSRSGTPLLGGMTGSTARRVTMASSEHLEGIRISTLSLIDLAGSEKATSSLDRRKEGAYINKSLLTLGTVVSKLSEAQPGHIPYRDSKLTRILQSSLSGNARVAVICTISPSALSYEESINTLKFATRVKRVTTNAKVMRIEDERALLQKYRIEILELRSKLSQLNRDVSSPLLSNTANNNIDNNDNNNSNNNNNNNGNEELEELRQANRNYEEQIHAMQLSRTALKERIDHLTKLILTSSSVAPRALLSRNAATATVLPVISSPARSNNDSHSDDAHPPPSPMILPLAATATPLTATSLATASSPAISRAKQQPHLQPPPPSPTMDIDSRRKLVELEQLVREKDLQLNEFATDLAQKNSIIEDLRAKIGAATKTPSRMGSGMFSLFQSSSSAASTASNSTATQSTPTKKPGHASQLSIASTISVQSTSSAPTSASTNTATIAPDSVTSPVKATTDTSPLDEDEIALYKRRNAELETLVRQQNQSIVDLEKQVAVTGREAAMLRTDLTNALASETAAREEAEAARKTAEVAQSAAIRLATSDSVLDSFLADDEATELKKTCIEQQEYIDDLKCDLEESRRAEASLRSELRRLEMTSFQRAESRLADVVADFDRLDISNSSSNNNNTNTNNNSGHAQSEILNKRVSELETLLQRERESFRDEKLQLQKRIASLAATVSIQAADATLNSP